MPLTIGVRAASRAVSLRATEHMLGRSHLAAGLRRRVTSRFVLLQGGSSFMETWFLQLAGQRTMHALRIAIFDHVAQHSAPRSSIASRSAA